MRSAIRFPAVAALAATCAYAAFNGLSLKIGNEIQPPGGVLQMKVFLTEPKPISTGRGRLLLSATAAADVESASLFSAAGDAAGAAVINGTQVRMICIVPSTILGSNPDLPLMTVTSRVRSDAAIGTTVPLWINPANLVFLDQNGAPYPEEIKPGSLTVANNVSITGVSPGSAAVPAGGVVVVQGLNFTPNTMVRIKEAAIAGVEYISPTELRVTLGTPVTMQDQEITVTNPDGTSAVYYSFQKTTPVGRTASALLRATLPIFANLFWQSAAFALPPDSGALYSGLALQNLQPVAVAVRISLVASDGSTAGKRSFLLAPNTRLLQKAAEIVPAQPPAGSYWLVQANAPVQMLGLSADETAGTVAPVLPVSAR